MSLCFGDHLKQFLLHDIYITSLNRLAFTGNALQHTTRCHGIASQPVSFCKLSEINKKDNCGNCIYFHNIWNLMSSLTNLGSHQQVVHLKAFFLGQMVLSPFSLWLPWSQRHYHRQCRIAKQCLNTCFVYCLYTFCMFFPCNMRN